MNAKVRRQDSTRTLSAKTATCLRREARKAKIQARTNY